MDAGLNLKCSARLERIRFLRNGNCFMLPLVSYWPLSSFKKNSNAIIPSTIQGRL
jgi:hypothetical protein